MSVRAVVVACAVGLVAAGCGGVRTVTVTVSSTTASSVPAAPIALGVPAGYRAKQVWHAHLSGQSVPEVVVASVGPPVSSLSFHSADVRVLEWDSLAHHWSVAFDAQKVVPRESFGDPGSSNNAPGSTFTPLATPLLDPKANVTLGPVRFVTLLAGKRQQLAFNASANYGGSGVPGVLAVVDFKGGLADVVYTWTGEGLLGWHVANRVLTATAEYWTPSDAHCCPVGSYKFTIAAKKGYFAEASDTRPWLGLTVHPVAPGWPPSGALQVIGLADKAPAEGRLRVGDVLVDVLNAPAPSKSFQGATDESIFDKLVLFHAGDTATLVVDRGGRRFIVPVRLGSMRDSFDQFLPANDTRAAAL